MPYFTVFTPTFNRAYILPQLFESLCEQRFMDFEWLIVDDGSTDATEQLVRKWQENALIPIVYIKKENSGKPRAMNTGAEKARGEFFFLVDSDDFLLPDALEKMYTWTQEIRENQAFVGVGAARGFPDGTYLKGKPPRVNKKGYVDATNLQRDQYDLDADMCEAYKTEIFRKFPMAEWPGENFAPEQIALNEIALAGYRLRWHRDIIYICKYRPDGLTQNSGRLEKENPMGHAMAYNHMLKYDIPVRKKFYAACQHVALSLYGKNPGYILKSNRLGYTLLALPVGCVLSVRRYLQFRKI